MQVVFGGGRQDEPPDDSDRRWWLERFDDSEIAEMAVFMFGRRA